MSMNRNDDITANVMEEKYTLHPDRINRGNDNQNLSLKKVATVFLLEKAKDPNDDDKNSSNNNNNNNNNESISSSIKMDGDQLRRDAQNPLKQKQKRILGLKRHASPSPSRISGDMCLYKTMHPCRIDVKTIVQNGVTTKKSKMIHDELSKQEHMIKSQGHELTKKYQLLNSDLRKLLRSTSEGNGIAASSDSGSLFVC